jgi:hypothetical protein
MSSIVSPPKEKDPFHNGNQRQKESIPLDMLPSLKGGKVPLPNLPAHPAAPRGRRSTGAPASRKLHQRIPSARSLEDASPMLHRSTMHNFYSQNQRSRSLRCLHSPPMTVTTTTTTTTTSKSSTEKSHKQQQKGSLDGETPSFSPPITIVIRRRSSQRRSDFFENCLQSLYSSSSEPHPRKQ